MERRDGDCSREDMLEPRQLSPRETWRDMGKGAFGRVARARLLGERVAVKEAVEERKGHTLWSEVHFLRNHPHPNITRYLGHYADRRRGLLVGLMQFSFCRGGARHELMKGVLASQLVVMEFLPRSLRETETVDEVDLLRVVADVTRALTSLHAEGIVHRDVKARNVLLTPDLKTAKLGDFGLARHLPCSQGSESRPLTPKVGPPKYRAPEVDEGDDYGTPCDVFSFGVMLRQLTQKRTPKGKEDEEAISLLSDMSKRCMHTSPEKRPTARELLTELMEVTGRSEVPLGGFDPMAEDDSPESHRRVSFHALLFRDFGQIPKAWIFFHAGLALGGAIEVFVPAMQLTRVSRRIGAASASASVRHLRE